MISLARFGEILEDIASSLPDALFDRLNGGVTISERARLADSSVPQAPRYVLGMYHHTSAMGRWITLYYGSFCAVFGNLDEEALRAEVDSVLRHELRHHLEDQAGLTDLINEDRAQERRYRMRYIQKREGQKR